jgi:hypothetical protein
MHDESLRAAPASRRQAAIAGAILGIATLLEIAAMARHPSVHSSNAADAVHQIGELSALSGWVHGALLALMLIVAYGLSEFALRRGLRRPLIRAGAIAYAAGVLVMLGAAMVSGFIISDLVAYTPHATTTDLQINAQLLTLCRILNQTWAKFGAVAMSAGIGLWSVDLLREAGVARALGVLGLLASAVPAVAIVFGWMHLDVHGMTAVVLMQAVWCIAVGVAMIRSRI